MAFLQGPSAKQAEMIRAEIGETQEDLDAGVDDLLSMCAAAPHLPDPAFIDRKFLEVFMRGCRMSRERARTKFESFCVSRSRHRDLYDVRSMNEPSMNTVSKFLDVIPLPKLTDEGYRVTILRIRPNYPDVAADITNTLKAILLISDARMKDETLIAGDVFIWEVTEVRGSLAGKVLGAANTIRRGIQLAQCSYPQRIKRIHVVGAPPFLSSSLQLMRSCVNEKIRNRYYLQSKVEDLLEYIPARVLPVEWGGEEESIDALSNKWRRRIDDIRDYMRNLNDMCVQVQYKYNDDDIYGAVGSFRKLNID